MSWVMSAESDEEPQTKVMSHVSYKSWLKSDAIQESRQLSVMCRVLCKTWVSSTVNHKSTMACHHPSMTVWWTVTTQNGFKRLIIWCYLKYIAMWKFNQDFRRKSIRMYNQWNARGLKVLWFFNSPINWGKELHRSNYILQIFITLTSIQNLGKKFTKLSEYADAVLEST